MTTMVPTDDGGLIIIPAIYRDFVEDFSKANAETFPLHRSIDHAINLEPGHNLPFGRMNNFSELSRMVYTRLRGIRSCAQELDHGFGFGHKDPMPYGRIDEWVLSYNGRYVTGLWDNDEESMEDGHYGGQ